MATMSFPGMTEYRPESIEHIQRTTGVADGMAPLAIALTTPPISHATLYNNGLYQNILILYKLFLSMGHTPYLIVTTEPTMQTGDLLIEGGYSCLTPEAVIRQELALDIHIEVGMGVEHFGYFLLSH